MTKRGTGFSLIEVVIATAIVLVGVSASSALDAAAQQAAGRARASAGAFETVRTWIVQVRSLAFAPAAGDPQGATAHTVVGMLFPHADPARNTDDAAYQPAAVDSPVAGSFVTRFRPDGGVLQATARFVVYGNGGWQPLAAGDLAGWSAGAVPLPAAALAVDVVYQSRAGEAAHATAIFTSPIADERVDGS